METNVRKIRKKTNQPKEGSYKREKEKKWMIKVNTVREREWKRNKQNGG